MSIFKACDIRGKVGAELGPDIARLIGRAVGSHVGAALAPPGTTKGAGADERRPYIAVGGDVRPSTPALKGAIVEGLMASGCHVLDCGTLPTPAFHFARSHLKVDGGVMVTGSHNPAGDNGFKISLGPMSITEAEVQRLRERVEKGDFVSGKGDCKAVAVDGDYEEYLRKRFTGWPQRGAKAAKIVVDAGNGAYSHIAPRVLRDRGYEVVELYCEPDGNFPNRSPNPSIAKHLTVLSRRVQETKAELGVAYDGDGDRVVFVDEHGEVISSDAAIVLFVRHLLKSRPGDVVYDIKSSQVVADEVRRLGGTPVMERSGHAFIRNTLLQRHAIFGGEVSGHFFFGDLGWDDGLYATLLMLEVIRVDGRGLAAMVASVPHYCITPDLRVPCPPEQARTIVRELEQAFTGVAGCTVSTLDGVRIAWPDGWALARPSVTEPLLTMRFEAKTADRVDAIRAALMERVPRMKGFLTADLRG